MRDAHLSVARPLNSLAMSASNECWMGLMYAIHLNHQPTSLIGIT